MGCTNCKEKKSKIQEAQIDKLKPSSIDKWSGWLVFIGVLLSIYGLISLIKDILKWV